MAKKIQNSDIVDPNLFTSLIKQANELKAAIIGVQTALKETLKVQVDYLKSVKHDNFKDYKETEDAIEGVTKATEELTKAEKQRKKIEEELEFLTKQEAIENEKAKIKLAQKRQETKLAAREELGLVGAYERQSTTLKNLQKQYQNLVALGRESGKVAKGLKQEIDNLDKSLKKNDASVGKFGRTVGGYRESILEAVRSSNLFGGKMGQAVTAMESFSASGAMMAGVIGGVAVAALASLNLVLTKTKAGMDFLSRETQRFNSILDVFADKLLNLDFKDFLGSLQRAGQAGADYSYELGRMTDAEISHSKALAGLNMEIAKNKLAMEDANATTEEKIRLAKESIKLDVKRTGVDLVGGDVKATGIRDESTLIGQARARYAAYKYYTDKIKAEGKELTDEQRKQLSDLENEQYKIIQESFEGRKRLASTIENLEKQLESERIQRATNNKERSIALIEDEYTREKELIILKYESIYREAKKNKEDLVLVEKNKLKELEDLYKKFQTNIEKIPSIQGFQVNKSEIPESMSGYLKWNDEQQKLLKEKLDKEIELEKEHTEKLIAIRESFTEAVLEQVSKEYDAKLDAQNDEIDRRKDNVTTQEKLAEKGLNNTLAFEKKKLAEAEAEEKRLQAEKIKREKEIAFYRLISAYADKGKGDTAVLQAVGQMAGAKVVSAFFWKGAEKISDSLGQTSRAHAGRDGYRMSVGDDIIAVDGSERILTGDQNEKLGGYSNEKVTEIVYAHRMAEKNQEVVEREANQLMLTHELRRLSETIKDHKTINVSWDSLDKRIEETVSHGMKQTKKYVLRKPKL